MGFSSCALLGELAAPAANFALGLYNADTYITKDCKWYEPVWFSDESKEWIRQATAPEALLSDLAKVAYNNDLFTEICTD